MLTEGKQIGPGGLPLDVRPLHAHITIITRLDNNPSFAGESLLTLQAAARCPSVSCHLSSNVRVVDAALQLSDDGKWTAIPISNIFRNEADEIMTISLPASLQNEGHDDQEVLFKVWLRYEADFGRQMRGYYLSEGDVDPQTGKKPIYSLTQFESTGARKTFPCWDDPGVKCRWTIDLIAQDQYTVLSNMPVTSVQDWIPLGAQPYKWDSPSPYRLGSSLETLSPSDNSGQAWKMTSFDTTPLMSSYLVALACGPFASLSGEHKSRNGRIIPLRIYATPSLIEHAAATLEVTQAALGVYEELFDYPFMLPKLDTLVAHDFDAGAMENWGLIIGRSSGFLYDEKTSQSSLLVKRRLTHLQGHEIAHMWFGNLVTMKWWDNLWLKEAFATLLGEVVLPEKVWPEWRSSSQFLRMHLQRGLDLDSQISTHPIQVDCPTAKDIPQIFDAISYSKGAAVLRMLMSFLGKKPFFTGVTQFLQKFAYGNAETKDLWHSLSDAAGRNVEELMVEWTTASGYPVIHVEEIGEDTVAISQQRYVSSGSINEASSITWKVPLAIRRLEETGYSTDHRTILMTKSATYNLSGAKVFKLNADTIGFYRVSYSASLLARLSQHAFSFSAHDRLGLISDVFALAKSGHIQTSHALTFAKTVGEKERDPLPLAHIAAGLDRLVQVWWEEPSWIRQAIANFQRTLFEPVLEELGYEDRLHESAHLRELRENLLNWLSDANSDRTKSHLKLLYEACLDDPSKISPMQRRVAFGVAAMEGGRDLYKVMVELYDTAINPGIKSDAIYGQCCTVEIECVEDVFARLQNNSIKQQDHSIFYACLSHNHRTRQRLADHLITNFDDVAAVASEGGLRLLLKSAFGSLSSFDALAKIRGIAKLFEIKTCNRALEQSCETIQVAATWLERDREDVTNWLVAEGFAAKLNGDPAAL